MLTCPIVHPTPLCSKWYQISCHSTIFKPDCDKRLQGAQPYPANSEQQRKSWRNAFVADILSYHTISPSPFLCLCPCLCLCLRIDLVPTSCGNVRSCLHSDLCGRIALGHGCSLEKFIASIFGMKQRCVPSSLISTALQSALPRQAFKVVCGVKLPPSKSTGARDARCSCFRTTCFPFFRAKCTLFYK